MSTHSVISDLYYRDGLRIIDIADRLKMSPVDVSDSLEFAGTERSHMAELASAGPRNDRLYKQGTCRGCRIPLFGGEPIRREWCGDCRPAKDSMVEVDGAGRAA